MLYAVPKSAKENYNSAAFIVHVHDRDSEEHYIVFHFSWKTYTFDVLDSAVSPTETPDYKTFSLNRWQISELCNALTKVFNVEEKLLCDKQNQV